MATTNFKERLLTIISSSNNFNDLIPILSFISVAKLKEFLNQNVKEMDVPTIRSAYFVSASINKTIPSDIIQHILSFQSLDLEHVKCVNQQWNKACKQNERNHYTRHAHSVRL